MRGVPFVQVPTTLAGPGRFVGRRQDRDQPSARQEHDRRVLPAAAGAVRPGDAGDAAAARTQRRPGRGHQVRPDLRHGLPRLDRGATSTRCWRASPAALAHAVKRSCEIKAAVVGQDEREAGLRAILNFGHTFGHAIESGLGYGEWLHGEAVGCGMVMAAHLSQRLGGVDAAFVRAAHAPDRARRPAGAWRRRSARERYLELMRIDKKSEAGEIRFVVIDKPGSAVDARRARRAGARGAGAMLRSLSRAACAMSLARLRQRSRAFARPAASRAAGADARRIPARPRPHRPFHRLPPPGLQDPGVPEPRGRPVPHPPDALARGRAARPLDRARAAAQRRPGRSDRAGARPRPHALRPCGPGRAQRLHDGRTAASSTTCRACVWWTSWSSAIRSTTAST